MSRRPVSSPSASDALTPDASAVERFRGDLMRLADRRDRILVAVSGGGDSVALLLLAHAAFDGEDKIVAATVDHGLRPESAREAAEVARLCGRLGVRHATLAAPMPARSGKTANLSARARLLRYSLLERHLQQTGAKWLATAHHADDQLETMIMRLNRGAGVAGLAGIRPKGGRIIRPLLAWRRDELAAIVSRAGITPVADPSNVDERFDRARLRKALGETSWIDAEHWSRSAAALGDAEAALDWATRRRAGECCIEEKGGVTLYLDDEPVEMVRRLVLHCLSRVDPAIDPRGEAVLRLVDMILSTERHPLGDHPKATLGGVLVETHFHHETGLKAFFSPAPPRRSR